MTAETKRVDLGTEQTERSRLVSATARGYERGIFGHKLIEVATDYWRRTGDPWGLQVVAEICGAAATMFDELQCLPEEQQFVRDLAADDRNVAAQMRERAQRIMSTN